MGGLARRVSYTQAFRKQFPATPALELNVGYHMNDQGAGIGTPLKDVQVQNTFALRAYSKYPFDAANLSYHDLLVLSPYLKKDQQKASFAEFPGLKTLISANLTPEADLKSHLAVVPYLIREVKSPRLPKGKIRVGIMGLSEPAPATNLGYVWRDPEKAAREVLPVLRKKCDLLIVLAYMPLDKVKALATSCQEVDVMIAGYQQVYQPPVEKVGNVTLVISNNETKLLGELRVSFDPKGQPKFNNRYVMLDSQIPDEPQAATLVNDARTAMETARKEMYQMH